MKNKFTSGFGYMTPDGLPPRHGVFTASGSSPLTIRKALAEPPRSLTIHGNTLNDTGVGDKTANLLDMLHPTYAAYSGITQVGLDSMQVVTTRASQSLVYSLSLTAGKTYIIKMDSYTINSGQGSIIGAVTVKSNGVTLVNSVNVASYGARTFTPESDIVEVRLTTSGGYGGTTVTYTGFAIYEATDAPSRFEPFGYKLPICISSPACPDPVSFNAYMPSPLYTGDKHTIDASDLPSLTEGTNIISVNTSVSPEQLVVCYMR